MRYKIFWLTLFTAFLSVNTFAATTTHFSSLNWEGDLGGSGSIVSGSGQNTFFLPSFGLSYLYPVQNANKELIGFHGYNLGLGISRRTYFSPYVADQFNTFWGFSTALLVLPMVSIGSEKYWDHSFLRLGMNAGILGAGYASNSGSSSFVTGLQIFVSFGRRW